MTIPSKPGSEKISYLLNLINIRKNLVEEQSLINSKCNDIDNSIKQMREHYAMQIAAFEKRLENGDVSAIEDLAAMFEEFLDVFEKQYKGLLKLREKAEDIQDEIFEVVEKIIEMK